MPQSRAEQEVRSILDEAICASVTASNSGLSWEKLMTIIKMQSCPAEYYATQRTPKETTQEINIGDSINLFRPEILKLIYALRFTGCVSQNGMTPISPINSIGENNTNSKELAEVYVSGNTSCNKLPFEEFKSKVNLKSKSNKVAMKKFGENMKQNDILNNAQHLNKFQDIAEGVTYKSLSSAVKAHTEKKLIRNLEEVKIKNSAHNYEYNDYLLSRYENEYNVNKLESSRNEESCDLDVQNKQEESQYTEYYSYMQQRNSDYQLDFSENWNNVNTVSCCTPLHTNNNTKKTEAENKCIGDVQNSKQNIITDDAILNEEMSENHQLHQLVSSKNMTGKPPCCNPISNHSSDHEADIEKMSKIILENKTTEYWCDICHQMHINKECKDFIKEESAVTTFDSVLINKEVNMLSERSVGHNMFAEWTDTESRKSDQEIGTASERSKVSEKSDFSDNNYLMNHTTDASHQSPTEKSHIKYDKCVSAHNFRKYVNSEHPIEYLFQTFIQPEDENNIKLLLIDNYSNSHNPETVKISHSSLNCILHAGNNSTTSSESINEIQYFHNTNTSNNSTIQEDSDKQSVKMETDENLPEMSQDKFSDKKVYWSSVGLVIEEIRDPNFLLVAGHSGEFDVEHLNSKVEDECLIHLDDEFEEEQLQHTGNIFGTKPDKIEDIPLTVPVKLSNPTDMPSKHNEKNEKHIDKGKQTKKSQTKCSLLKSVRRILHLSRKH